MSVAGISSSSFFNYEVENVQSNKQQVQQESAAQSDYNTLQPALPQTSSASGTQNTSTVPQAFQQLETDLESGNLSAAQQDYTTIQQDVQNRTEHHHHHGGGGQQGEITQLFDQLGQALQSGNLSTAQELFTNLQQAFTQFQQANGSSSSQSSSQSSSGSLSVSA